MTNNDQQTLFSPVEYLLSSNGPPECQETILGDIVLEDVQNLRATSRPLHDSDVLSNLAVTPSHRGLLKGCQVKLNQNPENVVLCNKPARYCKSHQTHTPFPVCQEHTFIGSARHGNYSGNYSPSKNALRIVLDYNTTRSTILCHACHINLCEHPETELCACAQSLDKQFTVSGWSCQQCIFDGEQDLENEVHERGLDVFSRKCVVCQTSYGWDNEGWYDRHGFDLERAKWCLLCSKPWYIPQQCDQGADCTCDWHQFVRAEQAHQVAVRAKEQAQLEQFDDNIQSIHLLFET